MRWVVLFLFIASSAHAEPSARRVLFKGWAPAPRNALRREFETKLKDPKARERILETLRTNPNGRSVVSEAEYKTLEAEFRELEKGGERAREIVASRQKAILEAAFLAGDLTANPETGKFEGTWGEAIQKKWEGNSVERIEVVKTWQKAQAKLHSLVDAAENLQQGLGDVVLSTLAMKEGNSARKETPADLMEALMTAAKKMRDKRSQTAKLPVRGGKDGELTFETSGYEAAKDKSGASKIMEAFLIMNPEAAEPLTAFLNQATTNEGMAKGLLKITETLEGGMRKGLEVEGSKIPLSRLVAKKKQKFIDEFRKENEREPTAEEIAKEMKRLEEKMWEGAASELLKFFEALHKGQKPKMSMEEAKKLCNCMKSLLGELRGQALCSRVGGGARSMQSLPGPLQTHRRNGEEHL